MMKITFLILFFLYNYFEDSFSQSIIADSNHALDLELYKGVTKGNDRNVIYSSYSLQSIFAETSMGARGDTAKQIFKVLNLSVDDKDIMDAFKMFMNNLSNIKHITVHSASKAYMANNMKVKENFTKIAQDNFGSVTETIDFSDGPAAARKINSWVETKTAGKIKDLIGENQLNTFSKLVMLNTFYLLGKWSKPFDEALTTKRDFHKNKTEKVKVEMMKLSGTFKLMKLPERGVTLLKVPLVNKNAEFVIILPDEIDGLPDVEKHLEHIWPYNDYKESLVEGYVPKFKIHSRIDMKPLLKNMGITNLFGEADLSGITNEEIQATDVRQKTIIDVNESGVEVASGTSSECEREPKALSKRAADNAAQKFDVNRPFIFCILYDNIRLVTGRVTNP